PDLIEPLGFAFMQRALLGSLIVALVCAVVGVLVVLRGLAFLGDAVAHAAFPGIVIAFLLKTNLIIGGMVAAVLASVSMGVLSRRALIFVSFDSVGAAAAGLHVFRYDALLLALIGLTVAVAVQLVGIVLVVAMLVTPAATARLFARDMRSFVAFAIALSVGAS